MWLLDTTSLRLCQFDDEDNVHPNGYAILSHTWGDDEVTFGEMRHPTFLSDVRRYTKTGRGRVQKIEKACEQARRDGLDFIWIDTCCIDKGSSSELSEAINSMYRWYKNSAVCYVYLADFVLPTSADSSSLASDIVSDSQMLTDLTTADLKHVRWFTRGWTLQELIAPTKMLFFSKDWRVVGTKKSLAPVLAERTGIDESILLDEERRKSVSVAKRFSWAAHRNTTRVEDEAYSLIGLFDVHIPMLYGEGRNAFSRLQSEIIKTSTDESIFAWRPRPLRPLQHRGLLLAPSCREFMDAGNIHTSSQPGTDEAFELLNSGLRAIFPVEEHPDGFVAFLNCADGNTAPGASATLVLKRLPRTKGTGRMVCEIVREETLYHAVPKDPVWMEMILRPKSTFSRFEVRFVLDDGLIMVDSVPFLLAQGEQSTPVAFLHDSMNNGLAEGYVSIVAHHGRTSASSSNHVNDERIYTTTLRYGQSLRHDRCEETFRMLFTSQGHFGEEDHSDFIDLTYSLKACEPATVAHSTPSGYRDVALGTFYLKAVAILEPAQPSVALASGAPLTLDPVWTIFVSRVFR